MLDHGRRTRKWKSNRHAKQSKPDHIEGRRIGRKETHRCAHGTRDNRGDANIGIQRKSLHEKKRSESHNSKQNRRQRRHKSIGRLGKHGLLKKKGSTRNKHPSTRIEERNNANSETMNGIGEDFILPTNQ